MWIFVSMISLALSLGIPPKMQKVKITDRITISLPIDFFPMTNEDMMNKAISSQRPTAMYTNSDRLIDFSLNITKNRWPDDNLELMKSFYKSSLQGLFSEVTFIKEEVVVVNKRSFLAFEFVSRVDAEEGASNKRPVNTYTYLMYALVDGNILIFNVSCPASIKEQGQAAATAIMPTIKLK